MADHDALIIMGGPMSVTELERYPYLVDELELVRSALAMDKPILGICLGAQLLAVALGGTMTKATQPEIGWHEVRLSGEAAELPAWRAVPSPFSAFHWHGEAFALPSGATCLAHSQLTDCQAFKMGNAWGLLFHLEITEAAIDGMIGSFAEEMNGAGVSREDITNESLMHLDNQKQIGNQVFTAWCRQIPGAFSES
jgi:GMP synthase-like glutamine amidotransferase